MKLADSVQLSAAVTIAEDSVAIDHSGSSGQIPAALNVAYCYAYAMSGSALKCILDPDSPNNEGSFRAIEVIAPKGSILNHDYPYSGANRALVGHYLPGLVLEAVSTVVPDRVIAGVGSPIWSFLMRGTDASGRRIVLKCFFNGGMGASSGRDGLNATNWPSNITGAPVEVIEQSASMRSGPTMPLTACSAARPVRWAKSASTARRSTSATPIREGGIGGRPAALIHGGRSGSLGPVAN